MFIHFVIIGYEKLTRSRRAKRRPQNPLRVTPRQPSVISRTLNLAIVIVTGLVVLASAMFFLQRATVSSVSNARLLSEFNMSTRGEELANAFAELYTQLRADESPVIRGFSL